VPGAPRVMSGTALQALKNVQFRWLFVSNTAFFLAMQGQSIVRSWLVYDLTGSELKLGLIFFTVALPMLFVSPLGGAAADRWERRNMIAMGQAAVICSEVVILSLLVQGRLEFWHLLVGSALMGCVFPFVMPARQAIVVNVVGKSGLTGAMALNMAAMNTTRVIGPTLAGFLIAPLGVEGTYMVGVGLYAVAVLSLLRVKRAWPPAEARDMSIGKSMLEGAVYMKDNRLVLILLLFGLIPMFLAMPFQSLLVVFSTEVWDVGAEGFGIVNAVAGVGGVVGSIYMAWQASSTRRVMPMMISVVGFGVFLVAMATSDQFLVALPLVFVANILASVFGTLNNTAIQLLIPDHVRGRVSSFLMMSFSLPMLGTLPVGAVAERYGAQVAVALAATLAVAVAFGFWLASPSLRGMDPKIEEALEAE
jgi:MFS family permease